MFYTTFRFFVEIEGINEAQFDECSGLQAEIKTQPVTEGGRNDYIHQLPGRMEFQRIVLKRGIATMDLWNWFMDVTAGTITRKSITITLTGYQDMSKIIWNIAGALPVKWSGPDFKAGNNDVAFETIELIHQGFKMTISS